MIEGFDCSGRIKEERVRMGVSQERFGKWGGVSFKTQNKYENKPESRPPDASYLAGLASNGADIKYIITGEHNKEFAGGNEETPKPLTPGDAFNIVAAIMNDLCIQEYVTKEMLDELVGYVCTHNTPRSQLLEVLRIALIPMTARRKK